MNPHLSRLQPYPFEKLRALFEGVQPPALTPIRLSIGEPQHPIPPLVRAALTASADRLAVYPATLGSATLREAIAAWGMRRYGVALDPVRQVLPVNGSREALFALAQAVIDSTTGEALVACPNPFYQIYEGAALLAGAEPVFLPQTEANGYGPNLEALSAEQWARVQLLYVCSPGNPTGRVLSLGEWQAIFELADRHDFVVAADECYSEIYFDEAAPPLGALEAAQRLGRSDFRRLMVFSSLSKRSNVPGLRSGFVAGDAALLAQYLRYRTYHGCAMSETVQAVSVAAWNDETHVRENRERYRDKFAQVGARLGATLPLTRPDAGFYYWAAVPGGDDTGFARALYAATHVTVLPGSYLARDGEDGNPGRGRVRIALVAPLAECLEAAERIADFLIHH